jgi:hypothetical protein
MAKRKPKTGKPQELDQDEPTQTLEDFVKEMHAEDGPTEPQSDMPTRDWLKENYKTKSAAVRFLVSEHCPGGPFEIKRIAKHLGMRYQHVRNVAKTPLKRGPNEDWRPKVPPQTLSNRDTSDFDK